MLIGVEYGVLCELADEKRLVRNINSFLKGRDYRKMYKWKPSGRRSLEKEEPRYSHYYCQFLKQSPHWYFDLYPNVGLDGGARFADRRDAAWTLYANGFSHLPKTTLENEQTAEFITSLVDSLGFSTTLLHTYDQGEGRR